MPTYHQVADEVAAAAQAGLLALWAQVQAGQISRDDFDAAAAVVLDGAADRAAWVADAALAARLTSLSGVHVDPLGIAAPDPGSAAEIAAIEEGAGAVAAIGVAARSVTRAAGQAVWMQGIQDHGVPGWRRAHSGSDCVPCTNLAVADFIAASVMMWRHKGCGCHPDPVLDDPQAPTASDAEGEV